MKTREASGVGCGSGSGSGSDSDSGSGSDFFKARKEFPKIHLIKT